MSLIRRVFDDYDSDSESEYEDNHDNESLRLRKSQYNNCDELFEYMHLMNSGYYKNKKLIFTEIDISRNQLSIIKPPSKLSYKKKNN